MSLNTQQIDAIYKLYPQVISIYGEKAVDADGNEVQYDLQAVTTQAQKDECKVKAKELLSQTDWTILTDVPLDNKADFKTYRATLRDLVLNPVADPVFPDEPVPVWK